MRINRLRLRFDDPAMARGDAHAIARRVSALVAGQDTPIAADPVDVLAREIGERVSTALQEVTIRSSGPSRPPVRVVRGGVRSGGPSGPPSIDRARK
jgi:hypothetical protein